MDGRNNDQSNPQNTQNRQLVNASSVELNQIIQNGVTPEQFAENARRLDTYSRMNAMGLQVYLQRQSQLAEQRRQDEMRLIQLAQQLTTGTQQQQIQQRILPAVSQATHGRQSLPAQRAVASSIPNQPNPPTQIRNHVPPYNRAYPGNVPAQNAQYYRPYGYHPRETVRLSHSVGGAGAVSTSTPPTPQTAQPPPAFMSQNPQYPQYSSIATSSQAVPRQGGASSVTVDHTIGHPYEQVKKPHPSWSAGYGAENAATLARESQRSQAHQMVPAPMQPTIIPSASSGPTPRVQIHSQFQIPKQGVAGGGTAPPHLYSQSQRWFPVAPLIPSNGQQVSSQPRPVIAPSPTTHMHTPADHLIHETGASRETAGRPGGNSDVPNDVDLQSYNLEATAGGPAAMSTDLGPRSSTPQGSQQGSAQSILLASGEKSTAPYTMRGLAASIKRALNAERLATSAETSNMPDSHGQKRMRSTSVEVVDNRDSKVVKRSASAEAFDQVTPVTTETQPVNLGNRLDGSPSPMLSSFPQVSPPQEETVPSNGFAMANSQHGPTPNFVPFSTLAGAVSFDSIAPVSHNVHSLEPTGPSEDLASSQQTPDILLHDPMDISLAPVSQSSLNPFSFPCRTPTPPLAATITSLHDDDEVDESAEEFHPSRPASPSSIEGANIQVHSISSANGEDLEMSVASGEDHVRASPNIASLAAYDTAPEASDENLSGQEADIFVRRTGLLDSPIREISSKTIEISRAEEFPAGEMRSPVQPTKKLAEISGSGSLQTTVKPRRKQAFYIEVPPPSEWVLRAKRREAKKKALTNDTAGQHSTREYANCEIADRLCPRRCHWNGCQAILNSIYALKQHVRQHQSEVEPIGPAMTVSCQWKQCRMVCEQFSLLRHLDRHIERDIICVYDDCDERFSRIKDLEVHEKSEHANDEPPPCATPRRPELMSLPDLPQSLSSYTATTRLASKPSITEDRHARLGPWVLGMTIGHPFSGPEGEGLNSTHRVRRATRLADKASDASLPPFTGVGESGEMTPSSEFFGPLAEYDLLEEPSAVSTRIFGDLDTIDVTRYFFEGGNGGKRRRSCSVYSETDSLAVEALV